MTEDQLHDQILQLFEHPRNYKKPIRDARREHIDAIKSTMGPEEQEHIKRIFIRLLDSLKPNGDQRVWQFQEQGKIPIFGAFLFNMRYIGLRLGTDIVRGERLKAGRLQKKTETGVIDPVATEEFKEYTGDDKCRRRFLVIWNAEVIDIGPINGMERNRYDAVEYVRRRWQ